MAADTDAAQAEAEAQHEDGATGADGAAAAKGEVRGDEEVTMPGPLVSGVGYIGTLLEEEFASLYADDPADGTDGGADGGADGGGAGGGTNTGAHAQAGADPDNANEGSAGGGTDTGAHAQAGADPDNANEGSADGGDGGDEEPPAVGAEPAEGADAAPEGGADAAARGSAEELRKDDEYEQRIAEIDRACDATLTACDALEAELLRAAAAARAEERRALAEADELYTAGHRETGLPRMRTQLRQDPAELESNGLISVLGLLDAHERGVWEVQQPPATLEFMGRAAAYLQPTVNQRMRTTIQQRTFPDVFARTATARAECEAEDLAMHTTSTVGGGGGGAADLGGLGTDTLGSAFAGEHASSMRAPTSPKAKPKMPAAQMDIERKLLKNMAAKLNFLRTPRHTVGQNASSASVSDLASATLRSGAGVSVGGGGGVGASCELMAHEANPFVVQPETVEFTDYEAGVVYEMTVHVRNRSRFSRRIKVLPPTSEFFSISEQSFPAGSGLLAPGMGVRIVVRFFPDSLADYQDALTVATEERTFSVELRGHRAPPKLTVPQAIQCSNCLEGLTKRKVIECRNVGGAGSFRLFSAEEWARSRQGALDGDGQPLPGAPLAMADDSPDLVLEGGLFTISPRAFALEPSEVLELEVIFAPSVSGPHNTTFHMVCDNCQVKTFCISGQGTSLDVAAAKVDGRAVLPGELDGDLAERPLWLGETVPGARTARTVVMRSATAVPLPYRWEVRAPPCAPGAPRVRTPLEAAGAFVISPASGVLPPTADFTFTLTFAPDAVARFGVALDLVVDTSVEGAEGSGGGEVLAARLRAEAMGAARDVELAPRFVRFAESMLVGKTYASTVTLYNNSSSAASFSWQCASASSRRLPSANGSGAEAPPLVSLLGCAAAAPAKTQGAADVLVEPSEGEVPPGESVELRLELRPTAVGAIDARVQCVVDHGPPLEVSVAARVAAPEVRFGEPAVDIGLVEVEKAWDTSVKLCNFSDTPAEWTLGTTDFEGLAFEETAGVLPPGGETHVPATYVPPRAEAGAVRGCVVCTVAGGAPAYAAFCAEALAPRAALGAACLELGEAFVGVPEIRVLPIRNMTMLPASFDWGADPIAGEDGKPTVSLTVEPRMGTLEPGAEAELLVTATPRMPGELDAVVVGTVAGMESPLAFAVSGSVRSLGVTYAMERAGQPVVSEPDLLDFGEECALREPTRVELVIRNTTAIEAPVALSLRRFSALPDGPGSSDVGAPASIGSTMHAYTAVPPHTSSSVGGARGGLSRAHSRPVPPTTAGSGASRFGTPYSLGGATVRRGIGTHGSTRPVLSDAHEHHRTFSSKAGQALTRARDDQDTEARLLGAHDGVAITLSPSAGTLPPWGEFRCVLTCYSDLPGEYDDTLECRVGTIAPREIPVRAGVVGTPLQIRRDRAPAAAEVAGLTRPLRSLLWGKTMQAAPTATKGFYVRNTGPLPMRVDWSVRMYCGDEGGEAGNGCGRAADATLVPTRTGVVVKVSEHSLEAGSTELAPAVFAVEPSQALIAGGEAARFDVTFASESAGHFRGFLSGVQQIVACEAPLSLTMRGKKGALAKDADSLAINLVGGMHPTAARSAVPLSPLALQLEALSVAPLLEADFDGDGGLSFVVAAPVPESASRGTRRVILTNPQPCMQRFNLGASNPFEATGVDVAHPRFVLDGGSGSGVYDVELPPRECVDVALKYHAPVASSEESARVDSTIEGLLNITFAGSGAVQTLPLVASFVHPEVVARASGPLSDGVDALHFGPVHSESTRTLTITLENPSNVDAEWSLVETGDDVSVGEVGERSVFSAQPAAGVIGACGLGRPRTQRVAITFAPLAGERAWGRELRFKVRCGRGFSVRAHGVGTADESAEGGLSGADSFAVKSKVHSMA